MSKAYTPRPEADVIVERQLAKGNYASADEVVRRLRLLEEHDLDQDEAELKELRRLIAEGDADIAAGRVHSYANAEEFMADITAEREKLDSREDADRLSPSER